MIIVKLDLSDLYHRVNRRFGRKLNFESVLRILAETNIVNTPMKVTAYGIQKENEASGFISCLHRLGVETNFKRPEIIRCGDREIKRANWDLGIGMDVVNDVEEQLETATSFRRITDIVLGSGSNTMAPLARYIQAHRIQCHAFGCGIGRELRSIVTGIIDVREDMLE
jgi:hypothetical protein